MQRKTNKLPFILGFAAAVGALAYWQLRPQEITVAVPESVMSVTIVTPETSTLSQKIHASGTIVAREDIVITAELSGVRITDVLVDEGKWVKKGQPLVELDQASLKNQLAGLDVEYKQAEQNYRRVERIKKSGAVSLSEIEDKRSAYEAAKAQHDDALLKVKLATITSPSAGLIYEREARIGALVGGNEPLFRLARDGNIELEALVSESDMEGLKVGQSTNVMIQGRAEPILGKIRLISPRVDSNTRATRLRISLPRDANIAIGSFAEAEIAARESTGTALPNTAVNLVDGNHVVWVVGADQTVEAIPVTVLLHSGNAVLITAEGLAPEAQIVAKAGPFLHAGDHVTVAAPAEASK